MSNEALIRERCGDEPISMAMVLGSGLSHIVDKVDGVSIAYDELEGFPDGGVSGHKTYLKVGDLEGQRVCILGGRQHYYEHGKSDTMREPIRTLHALGVEKLFLTNAAGSLQDSMPPGSIMALNDHINLSGSNPLIGEPTDDRFVPMVDAYSPSWRKVLFEVAQQEKIELHQGVYCWWSGPSFETPAEIRMIKALGADAVGMSTVPEVILARFYKMEVAAVSVITNMGAGLSDENISHTHTKEMAPLGAAKLEALLRAYLRAL